MKSYETGRGIELIPTSDSDRITLLQLKQRFPQDTFFTYDIEDGEAGLVIMNESDS